MASYIHGAVERTEDLDTAMYSLDLGIFRLIGFKVQDICVIY